MNYSVTPGDVERGVEEGMLKEKPSGPGWTWRVLGLLLTVALCVAVATLFAWQWHGKLGAMMQDHPETMSDRLNYTKDPHLTLRQIGSRAKAAIHLEGQYDPDASLDAVEWKEDVGQAFSQGGFELRGNQIIIPHTGVYFVYTQASFRVTCDEGHENARRRRPMVPLSHKVLRYTDSLKGDAHLLSAVRSVCPRAADERTRASGGGRFNAIYLGGVFQLMRGDSLRTETKRLSDVQSEQGKTFFGVFAL